MDTYRHILNDLAPSADDDLLQRLGSGLLHLPEKPENELRETMKAIKKWSDAFGKVGKIERKIELQAWGESLATILK